MAAQGCPCGYLGDPTRECRCTAPQIQRYRGRVSGPLRDRIDLIVEVPAVPASAFGAPPGGESTSDVRARVVGARARQAERLQVHRLRVNAEMHGRLLWRYCRPDPAGARLLETALERLRLTARGYDRVLKVARTIADLEGAGQIGATHVGEALQFRIV